MIVNKEGSQIIIALHQGGYEFEAKDKLTSSITKHLIRLVEESQAI